MQSPNYRFPLLSKIPGALIILLASLVLIGWQTDLVALRSIIPGGISMAPLTAVHFLLAGAWLLCGPTGNRRVPDIMALIILLSGGYHFAAFLWPLPHLSVVSWLYGDKIPNSGALNSMAPNTALSFLLSGLTMIFSGRGGKLVQLARQGVVAVLLLLAYTSILGYVFNIQAGYRIGGISPMALLTAFNFVLLLPGLLFTDIRFGIAEIFSSPLHGGRLMRLMVPFILVVPLILGYLRLEGERRGWYPAEVGVELSTLVLTLSLLFAISYYAALNIKTERTEHDIVDLMMTLNEGVLQLNKEGLIIFCNPAFETILGYRSEELLGRPPTDILVPVKGRETFLKRMEDRRQGVEEQYVSELRTKEGKKVHLSIKSKPLKDEWGQYDGILISLSDVTEEILNMEDLKAFSASAAHDLKSPLAVIESLTGLLDIEKMDEEQQELIGFISIETQRMRRLLDDLLIYSQMGSVAMPLTDVDINEVVSEVTAPFAERPVRIITGRLPVVTANVIAVKQLLRNLISNAVKYSGKAESPVVQIDSYADRGRTWFSISDNGIGMEASQLSGLFTPFKRFTSQFDGNGLGLVIVKRIVERHGGEIYAALNEPTGLSFHFTLSPEG